MSKVNLYKKVKKINQSLDLTFQYFLKKEYIVKHAPGLKKGYIYKIESPSKNPNLIVGENSKLIFESKDSYITFNITPLKITLTSAIKSSHPFYT